MRSIFALDIGTKEAGSGIVLMRTTATPREPVDRENTRFLFPRIAPNSHIQNYIRERESITCHCDGEFPELVFEGISSYGNTQGRDIHRTLMWIGRLIGAYEATREIGDHLPQIVLRRTAAAWMVGGKANDSRVSQAVRDRFGGMGATNKMVKGTTKSPGPLFGFASDVWAAAAVGIAYVEGAKCEEGWR